MLVFGWLLLIAAGIEVAPTIMVERAPCSSTLWLRFSVWSRGFD